MADKEPNKAAAEKLHKVITDQNVDIGDFDTFFNKLRADDGSQRLVDVLGKNNIDIGTLDEVNSKLYGGTNPAEKKNEKPATVSPVGGGSSGLPKTDPYSSAFAGRQQTAIGAMATEQPKPYTTSQVAVELKKKVELNPALKGVAKIYKDYNAANKNLLNAQMDLTAGLQGEKDVIQTDVLGKPVAIQGSITEQKIKGLKENVDLAKANKQAAKENLIKVSPAFKDKNIDIVAELQKDNIDVEETVIPQAVEKIKFVEDISDLEDNLKANGQTLDDWSKYVDTEAPKEFLDDKQRALFDVIKTGDEAKIKTATDVYYKDIDDQISQIDKDITALSVGKFNTAVDVPQRVADLKKQKQDLIDSKAGALQPEAALKKVAAIDSSFDVVDKMLKDIPPTQRAKLLFDKLYADKIKEQAKFGKDMSDTKAMGTGFRAVTERNKLRDIDQALTILAPIVFLNQKPDMQQSGWTRFGRGVWNSMVGDATGVTLPKKEDIADKATSLMATSQTLDNISISWQKALKATVPTLTDKAIDIASYITAIAPSYNAVGGAMQGAKIPQLVRMAFGNIGKYSPLLGKITPGLARMTVRAATDELTGRALGGNAQQDLTFFSGFGAQGATELLNNSPFGKLVTKAISSLGIKEVPKFVNILANINSAGTGSLIEEGVEEGIVLYQNSDSFADFKKQLKQFVDSPSDLFLFVASSYALGGFTSGLSPNVSKKFYAAADKAYNDLPPNEKAAFDNVVKDVNQGQEDAVMEVVLKTVDKVPNKVVDGLVTDLNTAVEELGKTEVGENGYEVKIGDTVYQGNTAQDLQNDIDDAQSLLAIYKGEQDNRTQNGITIEETETPPIAEADQGDVELAKPEAGVGVEGEYTPTGIEEVKTEEIIPERVQTETTEILPQEGEVKETITEKVVPEDVKKRITELEDMLSGDALSMQEKGMGTLVDRQSVVDELADLKKKYNIEPKPIAKAAPTFENVPVFTYTPQDVEKAKNEVFDNLSKLQVGSVIENSDGEIKVVTDYTTDKKGNKLIGVVTFTRLEDGSLLQTTNPVFASKSADGKIKLDYNPHTTGRNAKGEQVTVTDQITDKTIDLSKENIFIQDENGNLVKTNAFSTTTTQTAPQEGKVKETVEDTQVSEPTKLEEEIPFDIDNGFENQRKAGFIVEKGVKTNRKAPVKNKAVGKTVEVDFGLRDNPKAEYTVIEVDDIVPSHKNGQRNPEHFIPEAQPKNRSAAFDKASDNETIEIANNLKPERLAESPNAFSGAPVVNERGEVIQGNNRAESLRKHWLGQGAEYKQYLIDNAERLGLNPADIVKMKAPVLVRMTKVSDEGAIKLGQADVTDLETGGEKRLDPIKTANKIGLKDAKGLIDILADAPQDETLNQTIRRKAEALIDYLFRNGLVTRAQQASMIKNGVIVPRALEDIQNLFTQVLLKGSDPNLASIYENNTPNIVKQAIDKATPILLGLPKNVGITQNIQNALLGLDEFLKTGIDKVKEWANQPDMFNDGLAPQDIYSPLELVMIEQMAKAKRIIDVLNPIKEYAKLVTEQPATLFEEAAQPISKEQALKQVYGTEKSTLGTTERTPRLQEENGGTQQKPSGETTKGEAKSPTDREKTPPTEKVEAEPTADIDNVADKAGIAPKKAKKAAIQSDVIDKLVGNAANRREAYKEIADENIKEVAKIITDTNGKFDKVMDAIDNNDQLLADLEKKLGIKKICRI